MKKIQAFSLDKELEGFLDDKHYELREKSKSSLVNKILNYIKNNPQVLEEIVNG